VFRRFWLVALAVGMVGCASPGTRHIVEAEIQRESAISVGSYREIPALHIKLDATGAGKLSFRAGEQAQIYSLPGPDGQPEIVHVFKLPPWIAPYEVRISSFALGGLHDPALFYPKAILLDANFRPTRSTRQSDFVYRNLGAQGGIAATLFVNATDQHEEYVAITSERRSTVAEETSVLQSAGSTAVAVPVGPVIYTWVIPTGGTELPKRLRALATGPFEIRVAPYAPVRKGS
jgi:hypothetical protein